MKLYLIIPSLFFYFALISASWATSVLPINLEQLSTRATLIFYGEVLDNQTKKDTENGAVATFTTFKIIDLIKGRTSETHTIKQFGGLLKESNIIHRVHGVPEFQLGKQYILFLPKKSKTGFSSPLGLYQGSYTISTIDGIKTVTNGQNLTIQQSSTARSINLPLAVNINKPAQARLDDFINTIRIYNAQ